MASYHKTVRVLVQPRLYRAPIEEKYLNICIEACRGVCESYKELHYKLPVAFTSLSLQSVFLAGKQRYTFMEFAPLTSIQGLP